MLSLQVHRGRQQRGRGYRYDEANSLHHGKAAPRDAS